MREGGGKREREMEGENTLRSEGGGERQINMCVS